MYKLYLIYIKGGITRDSRLTYVDIMSHGYAEKAVKKCGMRYMGPPFYENWADSRDLNEDGTCASADVGYANQFADRLRLSFI